MDDDREAKPSLTGEETDEALGTDEAEALDRAEAFEAVAFRRTRFRQRERTGSNDESPPRNTCCTITGSQASTHRRGSELLHRNRPSIRAPPETGPLDPECRRCDPVIRREISRLEIQARKARAGCRRCTDIMAAKEGAPRSPCSCGEAQFELKDLISRWTALDCTCYAIGTQPGDPPVTSRHF